MPNLSYTIPDFLPFTIAASASVNSRFNDIKTLLNTTKLDDTNLQNAGITRATKLKTGTANYVLINDSSGAMSEEAQLALSRGGLGFAPSLSGQAGNAVIVNAGESGLALGNPTIGKVTEYLTSDVTTLTAGEAISANAAVCLDLNQGAYKVFNTNSSLANRKRNFLGFSVASAAVTPQIQTWTINQAFVASNVIAWTLNGRSYSQTFSASSPTTIAAIAAQIAADPDIQSAAVGGSNLFITITGKGALTINFTSVSTTGGVSQPTNTFSTTQSPVGAAVQIRCFGPITGMSSLTVGGRYYLDSSSGAITLLPTDTSPVFCGQAISSTVLFVNTNLANFQFGSTESFVRSHGGSTGDTIGNRQLDSEHFNFVSWSTGTSANISKMQCQEGDSNLGGLHYVVDGRGSSVGLDVQVYNKASWAVGTNRTTAKQSGGVSNLSNNLILSSGSTATDGSAPVSAVDKFNGSSWTAGAASLSVARSVVACFTQGGFMHSVIGIDNAGTGTQIHNTFDGASAATATGWPDGNAIGQLSASSPSSNGIMAGAATRVWNGSAWASSIAIGYTLSGDSNAHNAASTAFGTSVNNTYWNGGSSAATVSITTTSAFNGTAISTTTASSLARAGAQGSVI